MGWSLLAAMATFPVVASAQPAPSQEPTADQTEESPEPPANAEDLSEDEKSRRGAVKAYLEGVELANNEQWGDALLAFERAAKLRDAPLTHVNIGTCLRALGRYVAARQSVRHALRSADTLPPPVREDAKAYLQEFEGVIANVNVVLDPPSAALSIDGRPLIHSTKDGVYLAGVGPSGEGTSLGAKAFTVQLDPGVHVFRAVREGHGPALVTKSYRPGERAELTLALDLLPATVQISSTPPGAVVRLAGRDVGLTPVEVSRPAGSYDVEVLQDDFESYTATLDLHAGQRASMTADLTPYETPIYETWWFWTSAAAVIATGAVVTWAVTRPDPEPPPFQTGSTGWLVAPEAFRF
jgi:PEGA domain